jgi:hypothetical protein
MQVINSRLALARWDATPARFTNFWPIGSQLYVEGRVCKSHRFMGRLKDSGNLTQQDPSRLWPARIVYEL